MLFKKTTKEASDFMKENAPSIAFWVASVILIMFDARVLDVVYRLTNNSVLLSVGALFATALMFFIWKNNFQYTLSSKMQTTLSSIGMVLSLLASAVFGGMDYFVRGGLKIDAGVNTFDAVDLIFWGIPVLSVVHVVMLLWYWYVDPRVAAERKKKEADDDHKFAQDEMTHASQLLSSQKSLISQFVTMAQTYGKEAALKQLDLLGIDRVPFEDLEIPSMTETDGHGSAKPVHDQPPMTAPSSLYEAMQEGIAQAQGVRRDQLKTPLQIFAGGNGHGKAVDNVNPPTAA